MTTEHDTTAAPFGKFVGDLDVRLLDDGRKVELLADFAFIDADGGEWKAPRGWKVDGASIPRAFWTVIGGPFEGKYRPASVVHDVACDLRVQPWHEVHLMFYYAMLTAGVEKFHAKVMYYAVYRYGPRWAPPTVLGRPRALFAKRPEATKDDVEAAVELIYKQDPSLAELRFYSQP